MKNHGRSTGITRKCGFIKKTMFSYLFNSYHRIVQILKKVKKTPKIFRILKGFHKETSEIY